ncbi:hypothetical protein GCM10023259_074340 [Thermocatellispora tengchongensis]
MAPKHLKLLYALTVTVAILVIVVTVQAIMLRQHSASMVALQEQKAIPGPSGPPGPPGPRGPRGPRGPAASPTSQPAAQGSVRQRSGPRRSSETSRRTLYEAQAYCQKLTDQAYPPPTGDPLEAQTDIGEIYASGMRIKFYDECMADQGYPQA